MNLPTTPVVQRDLNFGEDSWCSICCYSLGGSAYCCSDTIALTSRQIISIRDNILINTANWDIQGLLQSAVGTWPRVLALTVENLTSLAIYVILHARGKQKVSYDISRFYLVPHSPSISVD